MLQPLSPSTVRLLSLLVILSALLMPANPSPVQAAAADTPVPVVADNVEEWSVGAGLLYWAHNCFGDEFNPIAVLKRKPTGGGTERTLESINDGNLCNNYFTQLATADGLYYFDFSQNRIERMPLGEPYTPQEIKAIPSSVIPISGLTEAGSYLYWLSDADDKIYRTLKDGSGAIETVAETAPLPTDMIVVGSTVYWVDSAGVFGIGVSCATLPCNDSRQQFTQFNNGATGHGLVYRFIGGFQGNYRLYWVQREGNNDKIVYRSCNQQTVCFLLPPPPQLPPPPPAFYAATPNWIIGDPILVNNTLFWTERDGSSPNSPTGDVKRKGITLPDADPAETIATDQAQIDPRLYVANDTLFFARRGNGIYSLPLSASAIMRDFKIEALEVTQAIQNLANQAPLIAKKTTYVRAYGKQLSGPSAANVEARLVGMKNNAPLPGSPLKPVNGVRALTTGGGYDRARLNDGWYFLLPPSWTEA
ncbi:MAG TPA: hypothetical protein VNK95_21360, partial [Caldilineaceae bacterium]|nr:hypothetical protein [Caldilineaceae bacterium]